MARLTVPTPVIGTPADATRDVLAGPDSALARDVFAAVDAGFVSAAESLVPRIQCLDQAVVAISRDERQVRAEGGSKSSDAGALTDRRRPV